jgi:hypothetical protein
MNNSHRSRIFEMMVEMGHEQIVFCQDDSAGYRGIIAIHSTRLGPAVGGTRFWNYASESDAMIDALRLSRGMTYKCAAAGMPLGGGNRSSSETTGPAIARSCFALMAASSNVWAGDTSQPKALAPARQMRIDRLGDKLRWRTCG